MNYFLFLASLTNSNCGVCGKIADNECHCGNCGMTIHENCSTSMAHNTAGAEFDSQILCTLCSRGEMLLANRRDCFKRQKKAAEKMAKISMSKFEQLQIGDCVTVSIPEVDQGALDFPRIYGVILEIKNESYQIGTRDGVIKGWIQRSEIDKYGNKDLKIEDVKRDVFLTLRNTAKMQSMTGGQGVKKCNCKMAKKRCETERCACFKSKVKCGSRCHPNLVCLNKVANNM